MKLSEMLSVEVIEPNLKAKDKDGVLEELVDLLYNAKKISNKEEILKALKGREEIMSTGIGHGVAIPHARCKGVSTLIAAFGRSKKGIDYNSLDNQLVYIFFVLLSPEDVTGSTVKALAKISRLLKHHYVREILKSADTPQRVLELIQQEEVKHL